MNNKQEKNLCKPTWKNSFLANGLDALILWILDVVLVLMELLFHGFLGTADSDIPNGWILAVLFGRWIFCFPLVATLYFGIMEGLKGKSAGKALAQYHTVCKGSIQYPGIRKTLMAYGIDLFFLTVFYSAFSYLLSDILIAIFQNAFVMIIFLPPWQYPLWCGIPIMFLYFTLTDSLFGCSLGKKLCGLRVYQKQK